MGARSPVIASVLEQHADEVSMLFELREHVADARDLTLGTLAEIDSRVDAHLDGLRIAGKEGLQRLAPGIAAADPGSIFAVAELSFEAADADHLKLALDSARAQETAVLAVISALAWAPRDIAGSTASELLQSPEPVAQRVAIGGAIAHAFDPGERLDESLRSGDAGLLAEALRAVGELPRLDLLSAVRSALEHPDPACAFAAARSAALLGDHSGCGVLRRLVADGAKNSWQAARILPHALGASELRAFLRELAERPETRRAALQLGAALGDTELVPWMIELLADEDLRLAAGDALVDVLGIDPVALRLTVEEREPPAEGPDAGLPTWDGPSVEAFWAQEGAQWPHGVRHLLGREIAVSSLRAWLRSAKQRHRGIAALELALQEPGSGMFDVRLRGDRQLAALGGVG